MAYNGIERRSETKRFCEGHIELCENMAIVKTTLLALDKRINGSLDDMKSHIGNSRGRNLSIILAFIGLIVYLLNVSSEAGANKRQIEINTGILTRMNAYDRK